jgi:hypothetical protein
MNAPLTRAAEAWLADASPIAEVERMVEVGLIPHDERLEVLGGEIVYVAKGNRHEVLKVAIALRWGKLCPEGFAFAPENRADAFRAHVVELEFIVSGAVVGLAAVRGPDVLLAVEVADARGLRSPPQAANLCTSTVCMNSGSSMRERIVQVHLGPGGRYAWIVQRGASDRLELRVRLRNSLSRLMNWSRSDAHDRSGLSDDHLPVVRSGHVAS